MLSAMALILLSVFTEIRIHFQIRCTVIFLFYNYNQLASCDGDILAAIKLAERDHELITQCVKLGTVRNVLQKGQRQTMENISSNI